MNLYKQAEELFKRYPQAVAPVTEDGSVRSMILMRPHGRTAECFALTRQCGRQGESCSLFRWHKDGIVNVAPDGTVAEQDGKLSLQEAERIAATAIPLPRDGSLWGWAPKRTVTALIAIYAQYTEETPEPSWTPMLLAYAARQDWPAFVGERLLGAWFWDGLRTGRIVEVGPSIAASSRAVWWVDTQATLGSDTCAVERPLSLPGGVTLPRGLFVYDKPLRSGRTVPSLESLLVSRDKTDLGPRFAQAA